MGKPQILPVSSNRQKAFDYWVRYCRSSHIVSLRAERKKLELRRLLSAPDLQDVGEKWVEAKMASSTLGGVGLADAVDHLIAGRPDAWKELCEASSVGYQASELARHRRERDLGYYSNRSLDDLYYIAFHATLCGLQLWLQADSLCRHLMNLWLGKGIDVGLDDQEDFLGFYWYLMRAQYKNEWPLLSELSREELQEFYPLFATVQDPAAFQLALIEYCDFRLARMHEYPSQHAKRRYPEIHTDALTYGPLLLFPAELLAFKALYERITGGRCSLEAMHPLLTPALMNPPKGLTLPENELTQVVDQVGRQVYGHHWKLNELVEVHFDELPAPNAA